MNISIIDQNNFKVLFTLENVSNGVIQILGLEPFDVLPISIMEINLNMDRIMVLKDSAIIIIPEYGEFFNKSIESIKEYEAVLIRVEKQEKFISYQLAKKVHEMGIKLKTERGVCAEDNVILMSEEEQVWKPPFYGVVDLTTLQRTISDLHKIMVYPSYVNGQWQGKAIDEKNGKIYYESSFLFHEKTEAFEEALFKILIKIEEGKVR